MPTIRMLTPRITEAHLAGDKTVQAKDAAIAKAYGNRFSIPLDFLIVESHLIFFHSAFGDRLEYELTSNKYRLFVRAPGDDNAKYSIEGIDLEFEMVTNSELADNIQRGRWRSSMTGSSGTAG